MKQYRHKLARSGLVDQARVILFKLHSPRIIGATTMFTSGCTDFHMKSKGRWAGDIAYIYSRFCPDMERECVRAMGRTDATPFMESSDAHWASIANWTEDGMDLGDDEEFDDGDEPLSDDDTDDDVKSQRMKPGSRYGAFFGCGHNVPSRFGLCHATPHTTQPASSPTDAN